MKEKLYVIEINVELLIGADESTRRCYHVFSVYLDLRAHLAI